MSVRSLISGLFLLVVVAAVVHLAALARRDLSARAGAIVMAIGIFALAAAHHVPFFNDAVTPALALALILAWLSIAASYATAGLRGTFHTHYDDPIDSFAVGTWVAGTAVVGNVVIRAFPSWRPALDVLAAVALLLWLWFLMLVARGFGAIMADPLRRRATGTILLATVSTQSMVLLGQEVLPGPLSRLSAPVLIIVGCVLYGYGLVCIVQRYLRQPARCVADDWHNTNCIVHGAVSITGLAAVTAGGLPGTWITLTWVWAALMFAIVEGIELIRLGARVHAYGYKRGVFRYDVSQWARNFTFGMFYAFTLALRRSAAGAHALPWLIAAQQLTVSYGQYAVLALLLIELGLFLGESRQ